MAEVNWYIFDETHERFGNLIDDLETIRDLISPNGEEDWFDDDGMWTEKGVASLGTYVQTLQMYENALDETNKKLKEYSKPFKGNEKYYKNLGIDSEQELYDAREKLTDQQYDYAKAISDTEQSVADMYESQIDAIEEWSNEAVEAYQDYIDVVKEALDAERDLYQFKKDVEKQTKDIAALERRIASLSGSDNAADIAERRKLEAELAEQRESLNDTYYNHAKDAQSEALDREAEAYEESMNKFIEGLRKNLESALLDMDLFIQGVTSAVITNAPAIVEQYNGLEIALSSAIIDPWKEAAKQIELFSSPVGVGVIAGLVGAGGAIYDFDTDATKLLQSPWDAGKIALSGFESSVKKGMENVVSNIKTNVDTAKGYINGLSSAYSGINDTSVKSPNAAGSGNTGNSGNTTSSSEDIKALQRILNNAFFTNITVDGKLGKETTAAIKTAQGTINEYYGKTVLATDGKYGSNTRSTMLKYFDDKIADMKKNNGSSMIGTGVRWYTEYKQQLPAAFYAKGTLGTTRDEFAVTDESWIGEEITLAAGKNGQLQYLKKGSAVMPADISANLVEWGKLNPDMMKVGVGTNLNMISNAVNKPEFNISFDSLIKAENITEETLPAVKKLVTQELNRFTKELNYAIKGYAR